MKEDIRMRKFTAVVVLAGLACSAFAGPKPASKGMKMETPAQCAAGCNKKLKAKGMKGTCTVAMCKNGQCPMMKGMKGKAAPKSKK